MAGGSVWRFPARCGRCRRGLRRDEPEPGRRHEDFAESIDWLWKGTATRGRSLSSTWSLCLETRIRLVGADINVFRSALFEQSKQAMSQKETHAVDGHIATSALNRD